MRDQLALDLSEQPKAPRKAALRSFHLQSHQTVPEALDGERRASHQEAAILAHLETAKRDGMWERWTPSEVAAMFPQWPLTSIRRALTNLTAKGLLLHHKADRRPGPMGAKESTWSVA